MSDQFNLERFRKAQERDYQQAISELRAGRKRTHWIWYIFPQVDGLGFSSTARFYAISGIEEARAYLADPVLGARLLECTNVLLELHSNDPTAVLGYPDDLKVRSSLTLFEAAAQDDDQRRPFKQALGKFYAGKRDRRTLDILGISGSRR